MIAPVGHTLIARQCLGLEGSIALHIASDSDEFMCQQLTKMESSITRDSRKVFENSEDKSAYHRYLLRAEGRVLSVFPLLSIGLVRQEGVLEDL